jgi:predicted O-linked N-acetylglucosamine transferase (SPINDLY family)
MNRAEKRRQKKLAGKAAKRMQSIQVAQSTAQSPQTQQNIAIEQAIELGLQHHNAGDLPKAEGIYQQILQVEVNHPVALHLLGVIAHQMGKNDIAIDLIGKAIAIKSDYVAAHNNLGLAFKELGKLDDAVASYLKAINIKPDYDEAHSNLGITLQEQGKLDDAVASYHKALAIKPDYAETHSNLGVAFKDQGKLDDAVASYHKALAIKPDYAEAHSNLGNVFQEQGKLGDAVASYHKAIAIKPDYAEAHSNLGAAFKDQGKLDDAVASYHKALAIKPDYAEAHSNLGNVLKDQEKLDDAVASYHKALAIKPDYAEAHRNLGNVFQQQGKLGDAVASYQKAIAIKPDYAEAHGNLGITLHEQGKLGDAVASYHKAIAIKPDYAEAHSNLGVAFKDQGKLDDAVASCQKALAIKPDYAEVHSNLIFLYSYILDHPIIDLRDEASRYDKLVSAKARPISNHPNIKNPDRRLRIGMVSGDFKQHAVGHFLTGVLSEINTEHVELFAYSTSSMEDDLTVKIKTCVYKFQKVVGISDEQLSKDIMEDGIDILIDLSGHTGRNRLPLFAWKPAPIQVTWLGYGGTTGIEAMDYVLCDSLVLPPSDEAHFIEKPWRLPDIWVCFSPPKFDIEVGTLPALANSHITFGSFNNLTKISDKAVECWARILKAVPDSRLLLKNNQLNDTSIQEATRTRFEAHGINPLRIILKSHVIDKKEHFLTYQEMDISLDTFPYSGGTTTIEAIWMGTPVVTLKGDRFISHLGESILHNVGLADWIADTTDDYVEKAVAFASDLEKLSYLRESLRDQLIISPVCDATRFAGNLEDAFRGMWKEWCAKKSA